MLNFGDFSIILVKTWFVVIWGVPGGPIRPGAENIHKRCKIQQVLEAPCPPNGAKPWNDVEFCDFNRFQGQNVILIEIMWNSWKCVVLSEMDPFRIVDIPKVSLVFSLPGRRRAGNH